MSGRTCSRRHMKPYVPPTCAFFSIRRVFFSSLSSVLRSVLASPAPGFLPVFFLRLSLQN